VDGIVAAVKRLEGTGATLTCFGATEARRFLLAHPPVHGASLGTRRAKGSLRPYNCRSPPALLSTVNASIYFVYPNNAYINNRALFYILLFGISRS